MAQTPGDERATTGSQRLLILAIGVVVLAAAVGGTALLVRGGDHNPRVVSGTRTSQMNPGMMGGEGHMMGGGSMMGNGQSSPVVPGARELAVSAKSFSFSPTEIHVRAGEAVTIVLTASDTTHDFTVDQLGAHVAASAGRTARGGLQAPSTPGRYTFYCSVQGHRQAGMVGTLVVDPAG